MVTTLHGWIDKVEREIENLFILASLHQLEGSISGSTILFFLQYCADGTLEKVQKYKTALLLCHALEQTELPEPEPLLPGDHAELLCGGSLGRVFRDRCRPSGRPSKKAVKLAADLYHKKKGALPVDDRFIQQNLRKHWKVLTGPVDVADGAQEVLEDDLLQTIRETVREVFTHTSPIS